MELYERLCKNCGEHLSETVDGKYVCNSCGAIYCEKKSGETASEAASKVRSASNPCRCLHLEPNKYTKSYSVCGISGCFDTEIIIPATYDGLPITEIADKAFMNCENMIRVVIPKGVKSIGDSAFSSCKNLKEVTVPNSVDSIGNYAFNDCRSLTAVYIPGSVKSIGEWAFAGCSSLKEINISEGLTSLGWSAFKNCTSLSNINIVPNNAKFKSVDGNVYGKNGETLMRYAPGKTDRSFAIPDGVVDIGEGAFDGCKVIENITIPYGITSIADFAFRDCEEIVDITIPESVTSIGIHAFSGCEKLESIIIPDGVTSIGNSAFYYCKSLSNVTLPDSIKYIGYCAFECCTAIKSITIPNSVIGIDSKAFDECSCLESITLPDCFDNIATDAFKNCVNLKSVTISKNVIKINRFSTLFKDSPDLKEVIFENPTGWRKAGGGLFSKIPEKILLDPQKAAEVLKTKYANADLVCLK